MNKRIAVWTVIFLLIATAAGAVLQNKTALAVNKPVNISVGLTTSESVCDFKVTSGEYQLFAGSADTPLTVPQPQALWRAAFLTDSKTMELYSMSADGSWADLGSFPSISLVPLTGQGETVFSYNGKTYRGSMKVTLNRTSSALTVINELPLEQYLYGVVPREMSNQWPIEALKAQAVAARTYVVKNQSKHMADGFSVCDETNCQVYGGYSCEGTTARQAVDATAGQILLDNEGSLIYALYHSNSGGYTEDNANINGYKFHYLIAKPDPYSMGNGLSDWTFVTSAVASSGTSMYDKLLTKYPEMGPISRVASASYPSGRVYQMTIVDGNGKEFKMSGSEFGKMFNPGFNTTVNKQSFMSSKFEVSSDARINILNGYGQSFQFEGGLGNMVVRNTSTYLPFGAGEYYQVKSASSVKTYPKLPHAFTFTGHGWGHGVGMSQWGAYGMAVQGKPWQEILQFYYDGVVISNLE